MLPIVRLFSGFGRFTYYDLILLRNLIAEISLLMKILSCLPRMSSSLPKRSKTPTPPNHAWYHIASSVREKAIDKLTLSEVLVTSCYACL